MGVINIRGVPDGLHIRVKVQAARENIPLRELVMKALKEYLDRHEGKGA